MTWDGEQPLGTIMCFTTDGLASGIALGTDKMSLSMRGGLPKFRALDGPFTIYSSGTPNINIGTAETALISGSIITHDLTNNVTMWVNMDFKKDSGNGARILTLNLRRGNQLDGIQCSAQTVIVSPTGNSSLFGPAVFVGQNLSQAAGAVVYTLWGSVNSATCTGIRYNMLLMETNV